jgi:hypothetical protein
MILYDKNQPSYRYLFLFRRIRRLYVRLPRRGARKDCILCLEAKDDKDEGVKCTQNHFIHRDCLATLITMKCNEVILNPSMTLRICCPLQLKKCGEYRAECGEFRAEQLRKGASQRILDLLHLAESVEKKFDKLPSIL